MTAQSTTALTDCTGCLFASKLDLSMTQTIPWLIQMEITAGHMPSTSVINMATSKTMMVQATTLWFGETPTAALGVCGLQMGILS